MIIAKASGPDRKELSIRNSCGAKVLMIQR